MRPFSPDASCSTSSRGATVRSCSNVHLRFWARLAEALCLQRRAEYETGCAFQGPGQGAVSKPSLRAHGARQTGRPHEHGSAVVEFTFLALLLMVPLVYFVITVGQIQGGSFAVVGAADQAAKVFVAQPDSSTAQAAAEQAVALALSDFGHQPDRATVTTACNPADCQAAGTAVTVTVSLNVPLPFMPFAEGLSATEVEASSTQLVGRYR
jgi:Flp pilus assembly protein TadG